MAAHPPLHLLLLFFFLAPPHKNAYADHDGDGKVNPFTPKAAALRYWSQKVPDGRPRPEFLVSKLSPLTAQKTAELQRLADGGDLSTKLPAFCAWAHLFCFPDVAASLEKHAGPVNFAKYSDQNFTNYGTAASGGIDIFKNYSDSENIPVNVFTRYARASDGRGAVFANYAPDTNVATGAFAGYGVNARGGNSDFTNYDHGINEPDLKFGSYGDGSLGRPQNFDSYSDDANAGDQSFTSYGKGGVGTPTTFTGYGSNTNVIGNGFTGYGEGANGSEDSFTRYGFNGNVPENNFRSYGDGGNNPVDKFKSYRDQSNVGDDTFISYAKNGNAGDQSFENYGNSFNEGSDVFKGYGKSAGNLPKIGFKGYGVNNSFLDYADKKKASFSLYRAGGAHSGISSNKYVVEEGKFFRESQLEEGKLMKMPDIKDKMPSRSFLPRSIASKLPFSTAGLPELLRVFNAGENSTFAGFARKTLTECERKPSRGETKRCVASAEDMIDFAVDVLGPSATVKTTAVLGGNKATVQIGRVDKINGGRVTESVSCHQSLFPYLVYFCHSVPKVRVYQADLLHQSTKAVVNRGVAICHIDTSAWGPEHGAFMSLGAGPGKIEVCHWIFENDMTWVRAD